MARIYNGRDIERVVAVRLCMLRCAWELVRATTVLLLLLLFYPITLTKLALFAPFWLLFLALLSKFLEARTTVVLSLFLPISAGVILAFLLASEILSYGPDS